MRIKQMREYIRKTGICNQLYTRYCMTLGDIDAIYCAISVNSLAAISLAFDFGMAKGYRAAKAEAKTNAKAD